MFDYFNYDYIILDCDGVIFDSNRLKIIAYSNVLLGEPIELVDAFIDYHKKNGGISRYHKFNYYFRVMKNSPNADKDIQDALEKYSILIKKYLLECDYVPGVLKFIHQANSQGISIFVVSGSDEKELIDIFRQRGILDLFKRVYGSPVNKNDNTVNVLNRIKIPKKGIFFGDSKSDYDAASKYALDFVFVSGVSDWCEGSKHSENIILNFDVVNIFYENKDIHESVYLL
jgi:phosphoglycolate phosphatase-like HAD superfamily hydrolase